MTNQWGYVDPRDQARQHYRIPPQYQQPWAQPLPYSGYQQPVQPVQSPLQLGNIPEILAQATPPRRNVAADAAIGALFGAMVGGWLGRRFEKRRARKAHEQAEIRRRLGVPTK